METLKPSLINKNINLLIHLVELCMDSNFEYDVPYEKFSDNEVMLQEFCNALGLGRINQTDVEFISKFIEENFEKFESYLGNLLTIEELKKNLIIPQPKKYKVYSSQTGPATFTEFYLTEIISFDSSWIERSWQELYNDDFWRYSKQTDYEVENWEPDSHEIYKVKEIVPESFNKKNKLITERAKLIFENVDKSVLLELKKLIDRRLSI